MENQSLCNTCKHLFKIKIKNIPGGTGDKYVIKCLINPNAFDKLVGGMFKNTQPLPYIIECNHFEIYQFQSQ